MILSLKSSALKLGVPLTAIAIVGMTIGGGWVWWEQITAPPRPARTATQTPATVKLTIPSGTPSEQIGEQLAQAGLIRSVNAWKIWGRWLNWQNPQGSFKAGTYQLSPQQSLSAIAAKIWNGEVVQSEFTIPEGWSLQLMANYFEDQGFFGGAAFLQAAQSIPRDKHPWLPSGIENLEGFLYPDTYQAPTDQLTPQAVVDLMLQRFEQVALPLYRQQQPQPSLSLLEWVTLASIVEREAVLPAERPRIAGVFLNRLRQGIALGADPTVEYALGIRQTPDQPLTLEQVKIPSAYNTYLNPGLPPGPIASPGLASLKAVLEPEPTNYLYFVARYDGSHVFSRTLAEHQAAQAAIRDQRDRPSGSP